jgi:hypothetical protein
MKLDGNAVLYQLNREFELVTCDTPLRSTMVDYPLLYDEGVDMSGHVVLVRENERPRKTERMNEVLCVCLNEVSVRAIVEEGLCAICVHDEVTFQHLYNRMQAVFVANERLDAQLRAYVDTYAGYQPLLDACTQTMGFSCMLIDEQFRTVCQSSIAGDTTALSEDAFSSEILEEEAVDLFMASRQYTRKRKGRKVFVMPGTDNLFMKNVFWRDRLVGALAMKHRGDMMSARYVRFLLNYLAPFVEDMYERIGTLDPSASRPTQIRAALRSALEGMLEGAALLGRLLAEEGGGSSDRYEVMRVERSFTHEGAEGLGYFAQRLERAWPQVHCVELDGKLYALANIDAAVGEEGLGGRMVHSFLGELPAIMRDNLAKAGTSRPFSDMRQIPAARVQADAALERGDEVDPAYWLYRFDEYAFGWLSKYGCGSTPPEYVCHPAIVQLARYDGAHGSDLLQTLETFMECRYNATLAAAKLFVARSTLINRLERITELTSVNLDSLEERTYLGVSLVLLGYLG